jgi:calcineurin-like phosphoesterase family protein
MKAWFWSDPHFGHKNILKFEPVRDFIDTEHMDNVIIENYNNTVDDGDIVFWLGDMFFCNAERTRYIVNRLKLDGKRNIWIRGNHDKETDSKIQRLGFMPCKMYMFGGMFLTHHPMTPENILYLKDHNPAFIGNVHGHTHSADTKLSPQYWQCVSMEKIDYKPIMWSQLRERFRDEDAIEEWFEKTRGNNDSYFKTGDHLRRR